MNAAALGSFALAPAVPQDVKVETKELTNNTTLQWVANTESDLAYYKIVWQRNHRVTLAAKHLRGQCDPVHRPKVSKDNFLFGVCAVDEGNVSPAVHPAPAR